MSILSVNWLGSPSARLSRSRFAPVAGVATEGQPSSVKNSLVFHLMFGDQTKAYQQWDSHCWVTAASCYFGTRLG